jgi:2-C-methyl-D-erythritol 4-phosphate cytidylyltransferase
MSSAMGSSAKRVALIPAAGVGARAGGVIPKQYQPIHGEPMLVHTIRALTAAIGLDEIVVAVSRADSWIDAIVARLPRTTVLRCGGETRAQTVSNALALMRERFSDDSWVLVHDAARCCITPTLVHALIAACEHNEVGGLLALPVPDTVKRSDADQRVAATIDRQHLWLAQTPQMFKLGALQAALAAHPDVTDEASAVEAAGFRPKLVAGSARNFKVTFPEDFELAANILMREGVSDAQIREQN